MLLEGSGFLALTVAFKQQHDKRQRNQFNVKYYTLLSSPPPPLSPVLGLVCDLVKAASRLAAISSLDGCPAIDTLEGGRDGGGTTPS